MLLRWLGRLVRPISTHLWRLYEGLWQRMFNLVEVSPATAFKLQIESYTREPFTLADGTRIERGMRIAEVHLDNERLGGLHERGRDPAIAFRRAVVSGLAETARLFERPEYRDVMAIWGMSLFAEAAPRMGFDLRPVTPPWRRWMFTTYMRWIVAHYHPQGWERFKERPYVVQEVWMSRHTLRRFAKDATPAAH